VETTAGARVKAVVEAGEEFPEGSDAGLDFVPRDLYLFHPESGTTVCFGIDSA